MRTLEWIYFSAEPQPSPWTTGAPLRLAVGSLGWESATGTFVRLVVGTPLAGLWLGHPAFFMQKTKRNSIGCYIRGFHLSFPCKARIHAVFSYSYQNVQKSLYTALNVIFRKFPGEKRAPDSDMSKGLRPRGRRQSPTQHITLLKTSCSWRGYQRCSLSSMYDIRSWSLVVRRLIEVDMSSTSPAITDTLDKLLIVLSTVSDDSK